MSNLFTKQIIHVILYIIENIIFLYEIRKNL
jgi:hypothetical protein